MSRPALSRVITEPDDAVWELALPFVQAEQTVLGSIGPLNFTVIVSPAPQLAEFAEANKEWLRICRRPAYAPDMNPAAGIFLNLVSL